MRERESCVERVERDILCVCMCGETEPAINRDTQNKRFPDKMDELYFRVWTVIA